MRWSMRDWTKSTLSNPAQMSVCTGGPAEAGPHDGRMRSANLNLL